LNKSNIEYLTHVWNFYPGCKNQENGICKLPCWAKAQAKRFGRSFEPAFNEKIFNAGMPRDPARIGVCFTGDLFGDWVDPEQPMGGSQTTLRNVMKAKVLINTEHQFFFLTKCPGNIAKWGKFPDNAWVGVTCLNAEQVWLAIEALKKVEAKHKWLSLEPLQGPLFNYQFDLNRHFTGIDWVVVGAQSHPTKLPEESWVREIIIEAGKLNVPVWTKNNMNDGFMPVQQKLPKFEEAK
jgi:protein gp37